MATVKLFVLCLFAFNYAHCLSEEYERIENPDNEISHLKQFVLDSFNDNRESVYDYNHAHILDAQKRDGPERNYFMLLDIDVSCRKDSECNTKNLICEVIVKEDLTSEKREISEDDSVCVKKLPPLVSVVNNGGFVEESVSDEVQRVAELAVEQLENDGDTKRTIFEIMSVKTQDDTDGKKLFLTLKVAKPIDDAVDMTEFETCEIEVSMNDPLVVENSTSCFPISEGQTDYSMSEEDMNEEAKKAVNEINKLSSSPFQHVLVKVVTADRSVTPGSQGSVTTIQFQVAPSLCLKNVGGERESPAVRSCPPTSSFESHLPLQCTLTAWERPWHPSTPTLYSGPICQTDKDGVSEEETTSRTVSELSEELDSTNEPTAKKVLTYCTGCPVDLDAESDSVRTLAQEVLTSMETSFAHRLVRVVKAQKQVVNGVKYIMTLEVVRTACPPEAARIDLNGCPEIDGEEDGGVRTCHIEIVERPWTDSAREVVVNDCSGESPATRKDNGNLQASPDSTSVPQGEETDLNEVVQAFDDMFGDDPRVAVPEVGLFDTSADFQETNDVPLIALLHRERRSVETPAGALRDVPSNERQGLLKYAKFALEKMDDLDEDSDKRVLEEIVSAQTQVVGGIMYHLNLRVSTSNCSETLSQVDCSGSGAPKKHYLCKVQVLRSVAPTAPLRLVKSECSEIQKKNHPHRIRRNLVGGKVNTSVDEPYIQDMAKIAVDHLTASSGGDYKKGLVRIVEAQKQVVSGILVHLTLEVGDTSCRKDAEAEGDCSLQDDVPFKTCNVAVWDRMWLKDVRVINFTCDENNRVKRELGSLDLELYSEMFLKFMSQYNKKYSGDKELRRRFRIFRANMKKVKLLQETEQGTAIYGATQFSDLSAKEFKKHFLGLNPHARKLDIPMKMAEIPEVKLPAEFDWRHYNVVTEVKNQGMCGSCWAFSVTGNVEGQWALRHGKLLSLSEQELVDCDTLDQGCNGGLMDQAYHAIENIGGLEDEQEYPYKASSGKCHFKEAEALVTLSGSLNISTSEDAMARWLFKNGPISIGLNANAMQFYFGGISHPWKVLCNPDGLDHGVLIVGFGVHRTSILHRTLPYWIIKNSWGPSWGEQGYYRIYRGDGTCGVNRMASSAIVN